MDSLLQKLGIDAGTFVIILAIVVVVLLALLVVILITMAKMYKRYDFFMRGKDAETLEDKVMDSYTKVRLLQNQVADNRERLKHAQQGVNGSFAKTGIVKYNAFDGMGGQSSFALALLDYQNNGFILNAMHSRTSCYMYVKEVKDGQPDSALGKEEQEALNKALGRS